MLKPTVKDRLSPIDLTWHGSFAAGCLFSSVSDLYLHLPHDPTTTAFYLCSPAYAQADKTKRLSLQPLLIWYCYPPHSPASSQRLSGCCEENLNHPLQMLSVTVILEVSNYCLSVIVLVGRREIGHCFYSRLCIGFKLVVGSSNRRGDRRKLACYDNVLGLGIMWLFHTYMVVNE